MKPGDYVIREGTQLFQNKNFARAEEYFQQALNMECTYSKASIYIYIANTYSQRGDYDTAIDYRLKSFEMDPDVTNCNNIGMLYRIKQDDKTAAEYFYKAIEMAPEDVVAYASLGALFMTSKDFDKAIQFLERANEMNGQLGIIHADLAVCYANKGRWEECDKELDIAGKLKAENLAQFKSQIDELKSAR